MTIRIDSRGRCARLSFVVEKAFKQWATKMAKSFREHGAPEGQGPEEWCNDILMESALEDPEVMQYFQRLINKAFLEACEEDNASESGK